jgi:cation diffusion facilitator CzcD-associated flavoprotein CzcO
MCDVESYIYMPLLEETGYIPTMKYTSSQELREHAERIARHYGLDKITWFRQRVQDFVWDETKKEWITTLVPQLKQGKEGNPLKVRSRFAIMATGVVTMPQVPLIPGIDKFKGPIFHTARWDYNITGGSDEKPALTKLQDKRVAIIGTGASAIQVVPAVTPWAKELLVFQRTPSSVDVRGNQPTDMQMARRLFSQPGWQQKRSLNWHKFVLDYPDKPEVNMVDDGWTRFSSFSALGGGPKSEYSSPKDMQKLVERLHRLDYPRQEAIRKRIDSVVNDPVTADKLKPWYPGWCKRACFHDQYLQSFNEPNVRLVDTNGCGVSKVSSDGLFVGDREYKVDVLILSTGYKSPVLHSPPGRVGVEVKGRHSISLDKKWTNGATTLHGMMSHDFPNFFWPGLNQAGSSPNFIFTIDGSAKHTAKILAHAAKTSGVQSQSKTSGEYRLNFAVEPSAEAEEAWSQIIVSGAGAFAATASCTPSYFNAEGEFMREAPVEVQLQRARGAVWPKGALDFFERMEEWRDKGKFEGLEISTI